MRWSPLGVFVVVKSCLVVVQRDMSSYMFLRNIGPLIRSNHARKNATDGALARHPIKREEGMGWCLAIRTFAMKVRVCQVSPERMRHENNDVTAMTRCQISGTLHLTVNPFHSVLQLW